jgi:hypothetical protein
MSTILETITSTEDQVLDYLKSAQERVLDVVKRGVEVADRYLPEDRPALSFLAEAPKAPKPIEVVDTQYAFAKKVLDNQRDFAKAIVSAVSPLLPAELVAKKPVRKTAAAAPAAA